MIIGAVNSEIAALQHRRFVMALREAGAELIEIPFLHGEYDSVFAKDNAILLDRDGRRVAMLARPSTEERSGEQPGRREALMSLGFDVELEARETIEGGDVVLLASKRKLFFGYGLRSSLTAVSELEHFTGCEVVALELVDPYFFHLDTALNFVEISGQQVALACKEAFATQSWRKLITDRHVAAVIEVDRDEALRFGLNWIEVNGTIIIGSDVPKLNERLTSFHKRVVLTPLDQFQLAGGSAACLATKIHEVVIPATDDLSDSVLDWPEDVIVPN